MQNLAISFCDWVENQKTWSQFKCSYCNLLTENSSAVEFLQLKRNRADPCVYLHQLCFNLFMFPESLPDLLQRSGFKEYILKVKFLSTNRFTCLLYEKYPVCKHNFKKKFASSRIRATYTMIMLLISLQSFKHGKKTTVLNVASLVEQLLMLFVSMVAGCLLQLDIY